MSILTVYFCGTGSHRFDDKNPNFWNGELVSTLASNDQGKEFAHWVAIDGPGSGNLQADELFIQTKAYGLSGTLFGRGWEENVSHALHIIKGQFSWQRKTLSEQEYKQLKAAGIPIEDVQVSGSWLWRTYSYGERVVTPQQLQEQIIKIFRKDGALPTQVNLVGWSRRGELSHAGQCHAQRQRLEAYPGEHLRRRSGAGAAELPGASGPAGRERQTIRRLLFP
ncbi:hypothetical protein D9M71_419170 [compost metagenome]